MSKIKSLQGLLILFLAAFKAHADDYTSCIYIEAVNNSNSIQMYFKNNCEECVDFVPVIKSSTGETRMGTNFPTLRRGTSFMRLEANEGQNVFFDWQSGTWTGKANGVKACR